MTKQNKYHKSDFKNKSKNHNYGYFDEEAVSLKELKKERDHKHYRNFNNALRSKNVDALMEYEDD